MVTITKNTAGKATQEFVRDVLRQNLTDVQSPQRNGNEWIFKSHEEESRVKGKLPKVYVEQADEVRMNLAPNVIGPVRITLNIEVWCSGSSGEDYRDQLADQIIQIISDPDSSDGSKTFKQQYLRYKSSSQANDDTIIENTIIRIKRITAEFVYYGS